MGVAYNDNSNTGFYQVGEGQGGVQIDAVNQQTGQVFSTQTWASGGYELSLAPGQYTIIASVNDDVIQTASLTMGSVNVEQDFIMTNAWQGGTREGAIAAAQPKPAPVAVMAPPITTQTNIVVGAIPALTSTNRASSTSLLPSWSFWNANVN